MLLLDTVSFNPEIVYDLLGIIVIIITFSGFFFKLRSKIDIQYNDFVNFRDTTRENHTKLEIKVADTYSKIENKISELERQIQDFRQELPKQIIDLFRELK